ncbi:hypothetical protein [Tahibacter amnicola]|uniref:Uncharacterized protein n=1 Tax=Tahibacter amnicola TaxID=2976241 RepID=A0ABY6BE85_9GAMM|nr:hypothetical protein [Tahibacter amnicola]UXI68346.1 hypothetical protein N4264_01460 [Tahibacter amnicola]
MRTEADSRNTKKIAEFAQSWRLLRLTAMPALQTAVAALYQLVHVSNKILPLKSYFNVVQDMQRAAAGTFAPNAEGICTEDEFIIACSYLKVEIAKQGAVHYLKGESPDLRQTKKHRTPVDLSDEIVLKSLSAAMARPDESRGSVGFEQIVSGVNHLARLMRLRAIMPDAVRMHGNYSESSKADVRRHFGLSNTDYEAMMAMARREGLIQFRNRRRAPDNLFSLKSALFAKVCERASVLGYTPQRTLNLIVANFFELAEKHEQQARLQATSAPRAAGARDASGAGEEE